MTVYEVLKAVLLNMTARRVAALAKMGDSAALPLAQAQARLARLEAGGELGVSKIETVGHLMLTGEPVERKGNGGKPYLAMPTESGWVNFYPQAKFGPFVGMAA